MSKKPLYVLAASAAIGSASALTSYCPSASDLTVAYGSANLFDQGWSLSGGGGAATKAAFNLLGGSVEFDIDLSGVHTGVNANIYTVSPAGIGSGFNQNQYCDGAQVGAKWCVEVDWIESNGNCGGATTLHTVSGPGTNGCTAWGCRDSYYYNGRSSFHMKIEYGTDGSWTTIRDGQVISPSTLSPNPSGNDWSILHGAYTNQGAVIYSSLWTGWVPVDNCGTSGDLYSSSFSIKNLVINGAVVQGPTPRVCSGSNNPVDTPTAAPVVSTPAPTSSSTSGSGSAPGGTGGNCASLFAQCGGTGYNGAKCCVEGTTCTYQNEWYSQCIAGGSTTTDSPTAAPTSGSGSTGCAALYGQCGGSGWTGATCCESGATCQPQNQYYSQCLGASL